MLNRLILKKMALEKLMLKKFKSEKSITQKKSEKPTYNEANSQKTDKQHRGQAAEKLAKAYLLKQGLTFIEKNYHCRHGEIDLIFKDNDSIVFIEVRFRRKINFGSACESIDKKKQKKLIKTAEHYLYCHRLTESVISRFDVVGITPRINNSKNDMFKAHNDFSIIKGDHCKNYDVEWIENAFQAF